MFLFGPECSHAAHARTHTTVLWPFFGTTQVSWCHNKSSSELYGARKITEADTPTIRLDATPSGLIRATHLHHPTFFMSDAFPATTLPIYRGLEQAPNMLACVTVAWFPECIQLI